MTELFLLEALEANPPPPPPVTVRLLLGCNWCCCCCCCGGAGEGEREEAEAVVPAGVDMEEEPLAAEAAEARGGCWGELGERLGLHPGIMWETRVLFRMCVYT